MRLTKTICILTGLSNLLLGAPASRSEPGVITAVKIPAPAASADNSAHSVTIAVSDFSGQDTAYGSFLAETILTDLAQSKRLHMVERTELKRAFMELKLQSTGLTGPEDVKALGKLTRADQLIVGEYRREDGRITINARLLNVADGTLEQGGGANVTGNAADQLDVIHRLARMLHKRITGDDLDIAGDTTGALATADPNEQVIEITNMDLPRHEDAPDASAQEPPLAAFRRASRASARYRIDQPDAADITAPEPIPITYYDPSPVPALRYPSTRAAVYTRPNRAPAVQYRHIEPAYNYPATVRYVPRVVRSAPPPQVRYSPPRYYTPPPPVRYNPTRYYTPRPPAPAYIQRGRRR